MYVCPLGGFVPGVRLSLGWVCLGVGLSMVYICPWGGFVPGVGSSWGGFVPGVRLSLGWVCPWGGSVLGWVCPVYVCPVYVRPVYVCRCTDILYLSIYVFMKTIIILDKGHIIIHKIKTEKILRLSVSRCAIFIYI